MEEELSDVESVYEEKESVVTQPVKSVSTPAVNKKTVVSVSENKKPSPPVKSNQKRVLEYAINGKTYSLCVTQESNNQLTIAIENKKGEMTTCQEKGVNDELFNVAFNGKQYFVYADKKGTVKDLRDNLLLVGVLAWRLRVGSHTIRSSCCLGNTSLLRERFSEETLTVAVFLSADNEVGSDVRKDGVER